MRIISWEDGGGGVGRSHLQDRLQLLQLGLLLLDFTVVVLAQFNQQQAGDVQHFLLTQGRPGRSASHGVGGSAAALGEDPSLTCSCFGFFSFSFPDLEPPCFSNRSKNLRRSRTLSSRWFRDGGGGGGGRPDPQPELPLTADAGPPSSSSAWACGRRGG